MVRNDIQMSITSGKELVPKSIRTKRLNVVIMTIMFHRWDMYRRDSNVSKVIFCSPLIIIIIIMVIFKCYFSGELIALS